MKGSAGMGRCFWIGPPRRAIRNAVLIRQARRPGWGRSSERRHLLLGFVVLLPLVLFASGTVAQEDIRERRLEGWAGVGHQGADLRWNIGFGPDRSNILSELTYRNLRIPEAWAGARMDLHGGERWRWMLEGALKRGRVAVGSGQDSDYRWAGRTGEYSRSVFDVAGSTVAAESGALGLRRVGPGDRMLDDVTVWIGYGSERHSVRKRHGTQVIPADAPPDLLDGLDSRYMARWSGPTFAVEPAVAVGRVRVEARAEWSLRSAYRAEGAWNLRDDLVWPISFIQQGRGSGVAVRLRGHLAAGGGRSLLLESAYSRRSARGVDRLFRTSGEGVRQDLHGSRSRGIGIRAGLSQRF
jgi:hypothetical protein